MKKILLVGGAGFIGAQLARNLLARGHEVHIYDAFMNFVDPFESRYDDILKHRLGDIRQDLHIQRGDTRSEAHISHYMTRLGPDVVVQLAAVPVAKFASELPEMVTGINVAGLINTLEAVRLRPVEKFVFLSSSFVYGHFKYTPCDEVHPTSPIDAYGGTKLTGEVLTRSYCEQMGTAWTVIRPSSVYGAGDSNKRVTNLMVERALLGKTLQLHDGGQSALDFTHVRDVADGLEAALERKEAENQIFNITRGRSRTIAELADIIRTYVPDLKTEVIPRDNARPERGQLDITKARTLLGFNPRIDLEEGLQEVVEEARSYMPQTAKAR